MSNEELAFTPALELRRLIVDRQVSPVEITQIYFDRIDQLDSKLNSYLTLVRDEAITEAKAAEAAVMRSDDLGPLHGVPISVKDLEPTKGIRTTRGSLVYKDTVPDFDSIVVERVRRSGAIVLGKTNTPEFGLLGHTENRLGDHCRNPWDTERTTGGSSGGAAASVAAGLCSVATGSDGGGSVRIPCGFCGIYGIKPTQGRIPKYAGPTAEPLVNLFSQPGPMTRTVADSALLLQVLAGPDSRDPGALRDQPDDYLAATNRSVQGFKVAWTSDFGFAVVDSEVLDLTSRAARSFEDLGCVVDEIDLKLETPFDQFWPLFTSMIYAGLPNLLDEHLGELAYYTREALERGRDVTAAEFAKHLGQVDVTKAQFADVFDHYDLILTPTLAVPAFPVGNPPVQIGGKDVHWFWGYTPFTMPINMIGHPAASVPCGFSSENLPIGLHIIGRKGAESEIIAASAAFEEAHPWTDHRPPVS